MSGIKQITLTAGQELVVNQLTAYIRVFEADSAVRIVAGELDTEATVGIGFSLERPVKSVRLSSTATQTVKVFLGTIHVDDSGFQRLLEISGGVYQLGGSTLVNVAGSAGTSASVLVDPSLYTGFREFAIKNTGVNTIYVGPSGVTVANGFPVDPGQVYSAETSAKVYGIVAAGTEAFRVLVEHTS